MCGWSLWTILRQDRRVGRQPGQRDQVVDGRHPGDPAGVKAELRNKTYELFDEALCSAGIRKRHRDRFIDRAPVSSGRPLFRVTVAVRSTAPRLMPGRCTSPPAVRVRCRVIVSAVAPWSTVGSPSSGSPTATTSAVR